MGMAETMWEKPTLRKNDQRARKHDIQERTEITSTTYLKTEKAKKKRETQQQFLNSFFILRL